MNFKLNLGTRSALKFFPKGCPKETEFCGGSDLLWKNYFVFLVKLFETKP
jgi:hypothetical protein